MAFCHPKVIPAHPNVPVLLHQCYQRYPIVHSQNTKPLTEKRSQVLNVCHDNDSTRYFVFSWSQFCQNQGKDPEKGLRGSSLS